MPDPPPVIWVIGQSSALARPMIAMVGARNASSLGTRMARRLASDLSDAGYVVAFGLARGIDAAGHSGAIEGGTVAVVAGGVDVLYPAENAELAKKIEVSGARISEGPMGLQPRARNFPQRNCLISGLATAVIVVEGRRPIWQPDNGQKCARSGALCAGGSRPLVRRPGRRWKHVNP